MPANSGQGRSAGRSRGGNAAGGKQGGPGKQQGGRPNPITTPWTPKQLHETVRADTNIAYRPTERAINAEKRASVARTKDLGNWWNEYLSTVSGNQAATQAAYNQAGSQTQAFIGQASALDNANTAKLGADEAASAALRGQTPSTAPAQRDAAAQAQRNYLSAAMGGATAARGANEFAYLGEQGRIGKGQSIASRMAEQKRTRSIESDKRELAKQRGDFATKDLAEKAEAQRDYRIRLNAFGLEGKKFNAEQAGARAAANVEAQKEGREQRQQQIENRQKQEEINNEGAGGGRSASEKQAGREGRRNAMVETRDTYAAIPPAKRPTTNSEWAKFIGLIASKEEVSPTEAKWAVERFRANLEQNVGAAQGGR